jgi:predicted protein tyrosine phosphatase
MLVPFRTTICGVDELGDRCELGVTHVLSILDPDAPEPAVFGSFGEHSRAELRFHDVIDELPDRAVPGTQQVQEILALGREVTAPPRADAHLLVHCHAGVSRSTAAMALILAQACSDRSGVEIMNEVLRIRSRAWPNLRIVELGDTLLGRGGDLIRSVRSPIAYSFSDAQNWRRASARTGAHERFRGRSLHSPSWTTRRPPPPPG